MPLLHDLDAAVSYTSVPPRRRPPCWVYADVHVNVLTSLQMCWHQPFFSFFSGVGWGFHRHWYGLVQHGMVEPFLLQLYAEIAHACDANAPAEDRDVPTAQRCGSAQHRC